jgi:hypothetical protein
MALFGAGGCGCEENIRTKLLDGREFHPIQLGIGLAEEDGERRTEQKQATSRA